MVVPAYAQDDPNAAEEESEINNIEIPTEEAVVAQGRALFSQHCTACHQVEQQIIGPALASVHQRRPLPWLLAFIKNSQAVIESGDEYAEQLFVQYNRVVMPNFEFLSNDEVVSILAYIKAESTSPRSSGGVNGATSSNNPGPPSTNDGEYDEAYSQKDDGDETSDEVTSGLPFGTLFTVITGMIVAIGIIFVVARKSTKRS